MYTLLVEDDLDAAANLGEYLQSRGHRVEFGYDGMTGLGLACALDFDVIVLDLNLPGLGGLELCRRIRLQVARPVPVLMLTARGELEDKLAGFEAGADDYLVKPFAMAELLVRLEALCRRAGQRGRSNLLRVGPLSLDLGTSEASRAGRSIHLHRIGERLLAILMQASPEVVSRAELEREIWRDDPPDRDLLRSHVYLLRKAVDPPGEAPLLHTVRGRGYRVVAPDEGPRG